VIKEQENPNDKPAEESKTEEVKAEEPATPKTPVSGKRDSMIFKKMTKKTAAVSI